MKLTDITIKNLESPAKGAIIYADDTLTGFGVRVSEGGTKSFVLTHGPRRQRETIGRVGVVGLGEARSEARRRLAEYTLGKAKPRSVAWNTALDEYLREVKGRQKARTHLDYDRILTKHFKFGDTRFSEISGHDLSQKLQKLSDRPAEHQHAFVVLRAFIKWAHRKHYVDANPMERLKAPHKYRPRERVLSHLELSQVWNGARRGDSTFHRLIAFLLLTGQRVGEISNLTHKMLGAETVTLPASLTKNSREHTFPLGKLARSFLPKHEGYLFPARGSRATKPFNGKSKCKRAFDLETGVTGYTIHDIRRSVASGMAGQGVAIHVVEKLLNHVSGTFGGIVGVYQKHNFLPEMTDAISCWEQHLASLTETPTIP